MKIALQLYSIKDEMEKDFMGTLEKVAKMGYQGVEFAGYGGYTAGRLGLSWMSWEFRLRAPIFLWTPCGRTLREWPILPRKSGRTVWFALASR